MRPAGTSTSTLSVTGNSTQTEADSILTAGTLTCSSTGSTTLDGANQIATLGAFSANGFLINDVGGLTGPEQPGCLHATHGPYCKLHPCPLFIHRSKIGQNLSRCHG